MNTTLQILLFTAVAALAVIAILTTVVWPRRQRPPQETKQEAKKIRQATYIELQIDKPLEIAEEDQKAYDRQQDLQETEQIAHNDGPKPRRKADKPRISTERALAQKTSRHENADTPKIQKEKKPIGPTERRKPEERGGRPRGLFLSYSEKTETPSPRPPKTEVELKPEIVCWKRETQWMLGVQVPEELLEKPDLKVSQNYLPLEQDDFERNRWLLRQLQGEVSVCWDENKESTVCNVNEYLLFKLGVLERDWGRCVKSCSTGIYLAVVPGSWERDEVLSGHTFVEPENTCFEGYKAHFFDLGNNEKISFRTLGGPITVETRIQFELVGQQINDASEEFGPLFGQTLPRIKARDDIWHQVGAIVVGEEGPRRGRWRKSFAPATGVDEQDLPSEIADRKSGWYYLRIYDKNDDLIDSLDFRFVGDLRDLRILSSSPLPPTGGYDPVRVEFCHEPGCMVEPDSLDMGIQIEHGDNNTILIVPPDPAYDKTKWIVASQDGLPVTATVLVERVWWTLGLEDQPPFDWKDTPGILFRDWFAATSRSILWLKLPRRRWIDEVLIGFEQPRARTYMVKVGEETVSIPLRDFGDFKEMSETAQEHSLRLWIEHDGTVNESTIGIIPAAPLPPSLLWVGSGRKKVARARAILQRGTGRIIVNGQEINVYFENTPPRARDFLWRLLNVEQVRETMASMDVEITVAGSSQKTSRQAKAVAHALARCLVKFAPYLKPQLKQMGFGGVKVKDKPNP